MCYRNKVSLLVKNMEEAGAVWATDRAGTSTPKSRVKPGTAEKVKSTTPSGKRARPHPTFKSAEWVTGDLENDEEVESAENATPNKKAKFSPEIEADQAEEKVEDVSEEIKG
jgi:hypothetical protein